MLLRNSVLPCHDMQSVGPKVYKAWEEVEPKTIVAIDGYCIGGGVALAVAYNMRIANQEAKLYVPEISNGMNISWQSIPHMVNLMGPARTKQLCIVADVIDAPKDEK